MYITKEMNSLDVFHLNENATNEEIREALKFHVTMYCGEDGNKQNGDGEYLLNLYQYHYKRLMNPEERQKLIEERKSRKGKAAKAESKEATAPKNELAIITVPEEKRKYIITSINQEIIKKYHTINQKSKFSLKKHPLETTYVVVGADSSLMFVNKTYEGTASTERKNPETGEIEKLENVEHYTLRDSFTRQPILENRMWAWFEFPWENGQIFKVNGVPSMALLGSKVFPHELIHNGKMRDCDFRKSYDIINKYIHENSEYISSMFENVDEEEIDKRMSL